MSASRANAGGRWVECDLLFLEIEKTEDPLVGGPLSSRLRLLADLLSLPVPPLRSSLPLFPSSSSSSSATTSCTSSRGTRLPAFLRSGRL